jgi:hypothetical protein
MTDEAEKRRPAGRIFAWLAGLAGRRAEAIPARPQRRFTWPLKGLLAASPAVPLLLLALAACGAK